MAIQCSGDDRSGFNVQVVGFRISAGSASDNHGAARACARLQVGKCLAAHSKYSRGCKLVTVLWIDHWFVASGARSRALRLSMGGGIKWISAFGQVCNPGP